jgi:hypothetical protein
MPTKTSKPRHPACSGGKWIRPERRLAIYLRDGLACCYCGEGLEDGAELTLDHFRPQSTGGGNGSDNLITACRRCNSSRGTRPVAVFARAVADYINHGADPDAITAHVSRCRRRAVPLAEAKALISRRGSYAAALNH